MADDQDPDRSSGHSSGHDPRQVDPERVERDEDDVARRQGSSDPVVDAEEVHETQRVGSSSDRLDTEAVLDAMPGGNAEVEDQVTQREPDTADHHDDDLQVPDP